MSLITYTGSLIILTSPGIVPSPIISTLSTATIVPTSTDSSIFTDDANTFSVNPPSNAVKTGA